VVLLRTVSLDDLRDWAQRGVANPGGRGLRLAAVLADTPRISRLDPVPANNPAAV
jgi:hypothetical protein